MNCVSKMRRRRHRRRRRRPPSITPLAVGQTAGLLASVLQSTISHSRGTMPFWFRLLGFPCPSTSLESRWIDPHKCLWYNSQCLPTSLPTPPPSHSFQGRPWNNLEESQGFCLKESQCLAYLASAATSAPASTSSSQSSQLGKPMEAAKTIWDVSWMKSRRRNTFCSLKKKENAQHQQQQPKSWFRFVKSCEELWRIVKHCKASRKNLERILRESTMWDITWTWQFKCWNMAEKPMQSSSSSSPTYGNDPSNHAPEGTSASRGFFNLRRRSSEESGASSRRSTLHVPDRKSGIRNRQLSLSPFRPRKDSSEHQNLTVDSIAPVTPTTPVTRVDPAATLLSGWRKKHPRRSASGGMSFSLPQLVRRSLQPLIASSPSLDVNDAQQSETVTKMRNMKCKQVNSRAVSKNPQESLCSQLLHLPAPSFAAFHRIHRSLIGLSTQFSSLITIVVSFFFYFSFVFLLFFFCFPSVFRMFVYLGFINWSV